MKTLICRLALLCLAVAAFPAVTQAQGIIRFIASYGNDANNCLRPSPCRTWQRGVDATPAGAELQVIDSAGYGQNLVITKSITVSGVGVQATMATVSGIGIRIDAPDGFVVLRNLRLLGPGPVVGGGSNGTQAGIRVNNALYVRIENCVIDGYGAAGISYNNQSASELHVVNTISSHNGGGGLHVFAPSLSPAVTSSKDVGVMFSPIAANVSVTGSKFLGNGGNGINLDVSTDACSCGNVQASITDTVMSGNSLDGLRVASTGGIVVTAVGPPAPFASASCDRCTSADNGQAGFLATQGADLNITHSVARGNKGHGIEAKQGAGAGVGDSQSTTNSQCGMRAGNGGLIESLGNNLVRNNASGSHCGNVTPLSEFGPVTVSDATVKAKALSSKK